MADSNFDVIVIGAGPGGYVTAIRAAQLGLKTAVVEREHLGGICLNWGCIPTKALLRSAEVYRNMNHAKEYGLSCEKPSFDLDAVIQRSRGVSKQLTGGVGHLLKKNKVTVINGEAKFDGPKKIVVEGKDAGTYTAKHYIIATGARARSLPGLEADGKVVWDYKKAMTPDKMPKSIVVVGSGAIGIEFASFYHTMGADVTVVEIMSQIMPVEDKEVAALAQKMMTKDGMKILTEAKVANLKRNADNVVVTVETKDGKKQEITVDRVISAVGVIGNTENLGLETTKVKVDRNVIGADEYSRTAEPGIYAIGDVAGPPMLAHKAEHEGVICVEKIAGVKNVHPIDPLKIPGCTYCHPQVASVGLTEAKAKDAGYDVKVGKFPFIGNGKAVALGEPEGLVKTVFDAKTGELLGAHMVGTEVTELIQGFVVAMGLETTEEDLMHTIFPHPTLSEMMHESVLDAYGRAIHF
ncbi:MULTISPECIES: dihydrolipoyl dehydrogenase [Thalassospira]|uniref:Dihydrolipoyl dehydrogenase n=2 Tax=Thalassospira TaxID=168934 RepID=A0A358HSM1_9PROT|nr:MULTISPECIES: dihydrolipoyl dehydrogenase [Thalassospira]PKR59546.1 dihydrolipoyl dehydrogenase [Thalassospira lohafexi]RCK26300.1 dihydrolipoamide dehydrogenase [Thalassospira lucentensis MCCC 1A00383 = DSM 14000]HBU98186.1 dihydrolipoyl dehydrogenase [Thalassospira lucentensis]HCW66888.1 dihydrolipoyl dehydrogenase [Thalassospira lucentensis]|tara:strand:+ start:138001 stop:139398 length:1398 start_codon:yes stop_codon:yes gene_type:complete